MSYQSYKELKVWQKGMELANEIYALTKKLPVDERYCLLSQMRRAAISIPSNVAEGHGRNSDKSFKQFLLISKGSCSELETQILICIAQNYITEEESKKAIELIDNVSRMLTSLIVKQEN